MAGVFRVGDRVRLLGLPDWLVHDLPESEQREMLAFIDQSTEITAVDDAGYLRVGFGHRSEVGDDAHYAGHSFCVTSECLQRP